MALLRHQIYILVSSLDADDITATVAAESIIAIVSDIIRIQLEIGDFQGGCLLWLHALAFVPFLRAQGRLWCKTTALQQSHNLFEAAAAAASAEPGGILEYDSMLLAEALSSASRSPSASYCKAAENILQRFSASCCCVTTQSSRHKAVSFGRSELLSSCALPSEGIEGVQLRPKISTGDATASSSTARFHDSSSMWRDQAGTPQVFEPRQPSSASHLQSSYGASIYVHADSPENLRPGQFQMVLMQLEQCQLHLSKNQLNSHDMMS
jgi:hypothetical protein